MLYTIWVELDFDETYLKEIQSVCLVMSEKYIRAHEKEILVYGNIIEHRLNNSVDFEALIKENIYYLKMCEKYHYPLILIDDKYDAFEQAKRLFHCDKSDTIKP